MVGHPVGSSHEFPQRVLLQPSFRSLPEPEDGHLQKGHPSWVASIWEHTCKCKPTKT